MIRAQRIELAVSASGALTTYGDAIVGLLHALVYVPGTLDTGTDLTITDEATGTALWAITNTGTSLLTKMPRGACVGITNTALVYAGTDPVTDRLPITGRVKVVVAQGGTSLTGYLWIVWDDGRG